MPFTGWVSLIASVAPPSGPVPARAPSSTCMYACRRGSSRLIRSRWSSTTSLLPAASVASSQAVSAIRLFFTAMPITWTQNEEANRLLDSDPLALLIGMVLDQQVRMEHAFSGPYELKRRLGSLDARQIASMDPEELDRAFRQRPALHRFPRTMARRVQAMCAAVARDYDGDAGA